MPVFIRTYSPSYRMPLPLYGSGGRDLRTTAANCPTSHLSMPEMVNRAHPSPHRTTYPALAAQRPPGGFCPPARPGCCPASRAIPDPCTSRRLEKPVVTPTTMLFNVRVKPCWARCSRNRSALDHDLAVLLLKLHFRVQALLQDAFGPLTVTLFPASTVTVTLAGTAIGARPIRDMMTSSLNPAALWLYCRNQTALPDVADNLAADLLARLPAVISPLGVETMLTPRLRTHGMSR